MPVGPDPRQSLHTYNVFDQLRSRSEQKGVKVEFFKDFRGLPWRFSDLPVDSSPTPQVKIDAPSRNHLLLLLEQVVIKASPRNHLYLRARHVMI